MGTTPPQSAGAFVIKIESPIPAIRSNHLLRWSSTLAITVPSGMTASDLTILFRCKKLPSANESSGSNPTSILVVSLTSVPLAILEGANGVLPTAATVALAASHSFSDMPCFAARFSSYARCDADIVMVCDPYLPTLTDTYHKGTKSGKPSIPIHKP